MGRHLPAGLPRPPVQPLHGRLAVPDGVELLPRVPEDGARARQVSGRASEEGRGLGRGRLRESGGGCAKRFVEMGFS